MKKILTTLLCVFLALVFIGAVIHPDNNLQGTIDLLKIDIAPILSVFGFATDTVKSFIPDQIVEVENPSYMSDILELKNNLEIVLLKWFDDKDILEELKDQGTFNLRVFKSNLHIEHKVCCVVMTFKGNNIRAFYCPVCNLIVGIAEVHAFKVNPLLWLYPQTNEKISLGMVLNYYVLPYDTYLKYLT